MIRVLVNGAHGRMGQEAVKAVQADAELTLVGSAGKSDDLKAMIRDTKAQVVIDFTVASVAFESASTIIAAGAHPVIGTSGLSPEQIKKLQIQCVEKKLGGIIAPNFSIGAVLMMRYAKDAARYYQHVEIIEMHHAGKEDAPSGTAIKTAQMIAEARAEQLPKKTIRETIPGSRGASCENIPIHAVRLPGLIAAQEVIFGAPGETLSIRETSIDRSSFMPGVCLSCKRVITLDKLVYGLEDILD
jgi:4-hydroxy-tetrahydrodipicolinate reductase